MESEENYYVYFFECPVGFYSCAASACSQCAYSRAAASGN